MCLPVCLNLISVQIPKYHIYVDYSEPEKSGIRYNVSQEELVRVFATPFVAGQSFWFMGRLLNPIKVTKIVIFWSYETADKLTLPNQENLVTFKDKKYVIQSIINSKVKGAYVCTEKFLPSEKTLMFNQLFIPSSGVALRRIFVVSGKDAEMKKSIIGALTKLKLVPLLLCEEPSQGRKIAECFADYADVSFALVLLSPDEYYCTKNEALTKQKLKPQQQVIFHLGFLLGKLGKNKVLVLFRECEGFQIPDIEGLKTVAFDDRESWKLALIRELSDSGLRVDADNILK